MWEFGGFIVSNILDFGFGVWISIPGQANYFPNIILYWVEVWEKSIGLASKRLDELGLFKTSDGEIIPYEDSQLDLAMDAYVLHNIPLTKH